MGGSILRRPWWQLALGVVALILVVAPNVWLIGRSLGTILGGEVAVDWHHFTEAGRRVHSGGLYEITDDYGFRYSPVLAHTFGVVAPIGDVAWRLLHVGAAFALPTWPMRLVTLALWPFWFDVEAGNVMVFVLLAAAWALRGNTVAIGAFMVLAVVMPRPLMLPVLGWLLWRHSAWRVAFVAIFVAHLAAVLATGWGGEWLSVLLTSGDEIASPLNLGPSRFIGAAWLVIGLPLAAWLTWHGRLGWASLAVSPYWLPYYLLMPVLELERQGGRSTSVTSPVAIRTSKRYN